MRRIGIYMNIVVWYCQHCDVVNDEVRDLRRPGETDEGRNREELKAH